MQNISRVRIFLLIILASGVISGISLKSYYLEILHDLPEFGNSVIYDQNGSYENGLFKMKIIFQIQESKQIRFNTFCLDSILVFFPDFAFKSKFFIPFIKFPFLIFIAVDRKKILENKRRFEIYTLIKENPGMYFSEISRETNFKKGTVEYHLKMMESGGIIKPFSENGKLYYFIKNSQYSKEEKQLILILRDETLKKVIMEIYKNPKNNNKKIAETIGYSESTASKHLKFLKNHGIIESRTQGWYTMYDISDEFHDLLEKYIYPERWER